MQMSDLQMDGQPVQRQQPAHFHSAVETVKAPTADEEKAMKELLSGVTLETLDNQVSAPMGQPIQPAIQIPAAPATPPQSAEIPQKFQRPDGTVDEEKLKASSENLNQAIEKKQKSIEEMLAEYHENEKKWTELGNKAKQLQSTPQISQPPVPQNQPVMDPNADQVRQQLLALSQRDPIAFAVEIAKAVSRREAEDVAAPALQIVQNLAEQQKAADRRQQMLSLAERDARIQNPALYAELMNELNTDPGYRTLKNPVKAAWNEVKERLRLGEPMAPAQPSTPSPTLGRGIPPSVSSLPQAFDPSLMRSVNPLSTDGRQMEDALLKKLAEQTWR